jgi:hypothetical protein
MIRGALNATYSHSTTSTAIRPKTTAYRTKFSILQSLSLKEINEIDIFIYLGGSLDGTAAIVK